jgi:hypothetical protein
MARQTKARPWLGTTIFVVIIVLSGLWLNLAGKMQNPFRVLPDIANFISSGGETSGSERNEGFRPSASASGAAATPGSSAVTTPTGSSTTTTPSASRTAPSRGGQFQPGNGQRPPQQGNFGGGEQRGGGDRGGEGDMQWNMYGDVLFDLWFIAAITAVVVVLSQLIKFLSRRFRPGARPRVFGAA